MNRRPVDYEGTGLVRHDTDLGFTRVQERGTNFRDFRGCPCAGQKSHPLVPPQLPSAPSPPDPVESAQASFLRPGTPMVLAIGLWTFLRTLVAGSAAVALENLALRHQLLVLQRSVRRPRLARRDRVLFSEAACHEQRSLVVSARPLSPPRLGGRRTAVCRARCARFVILLFALSVANDESPAHDG